MDETNDLPQDLADAVKKSWSESTDTSIAHYMQQSNQNIGSPIGTPINLEQDNNRFNKTLMGSINQPDNTTKITTHMSSEIIAPKPQSYLRKQDKDGKNSNLKTMSSEFEHNIKDNNDEEDPIINDVDKYGKAASYHLLRHHYSISEDKDSASNLLNELELGNFDENVKSNHKPEFKQNFNFNQTTSLHHQLKNPFDTSNSGVLPTPVIPNNTRRRGSIQEVQWIRQYLNPRSSFSGASSNEPLPIPANKNKNNNHNNSHNNSHIHNQQNKEQSPTKTQNYQYNTNAPTTNVNTDDTSLPTSPHIGTLISPNINLETSETVKNKFIQVDSNTSNVDSTISNENDVTMMNKCWVTTLLDNSQESMQMVLVLCYSLTLNNSKFPIFILYDEKIDVTPLQNCQVNLVPIFKNDAKSMSPVSDTNLTNEFGSSNSNDNSTEESFIHLLNKNWFILSLFISFVNSNYDLICYISPTCLIVDNIDELLIVESINNEIDNETCVLLTNVIENDETPQLIIIKPNEEVAMCIKEFLTIYSGDQKERYEKINKLLQMNDMNILHELFGDTWGQISSDGYVKLLQPNNESININYCKILDFKNIRPWLMDADSILKYKDNENNQNPPKDSKTVIQKWHEIWLEIWSIYQKNVRN